MAGKYLGRRVRHPRRRAGPALPAPRERAGPVDGGRAEVRPVLDAQRAAHRGRGEDEQVPGQRGAGLGGDQAVPGPGGAALPDPAALPLDGGVLRRRDRRGGGGAGPDRQLRRAGDGAGRAGRGGGAGGVRDRDGRRPGHAGRRGRAARGGPGRQRRARRRSTGTGSATGWPRSPGCWTCSGSTPTARTGRPPVPTGSSEPWSTGWSPPCWPSGRRPARRRDFAAADAIRDALADLGVEVSDTAAGSPLVPLRNGGLTCPGTASARAPSGARARATPPAPGGRVRRGLEGRGPTPKAEDRPYHAAHKAKKAGGAVAAGEPRPVRGPGGPAPGRSGWPAATPCWRR